MEKDTKKKEDTKKELKQLNDTVQIDRVGIFVDSDDYELDKIAYKKNNNGNKLLIIAFVLIFIGVGITTYFQVSSYYEKRKLLSENSNIVEVSSKSDKLTIINNSKVPSFDVPSLVGSSVNETTVENINKLTLEVHKKASDDNIHKYNVRYRISENAYDYLTNSNSPEVMVRFAYSYDGVNWEYVKSALSTTNSTLTPGMGNYFDITGLNTTINVATNYEIKGKLKEEVKVIWKAETTFKHLDDESNKSGAKKYEASFDIEYVS